MNLFKSQANLYLSYFFMMACIAVSISLPYSVKPNSIAIILLSASSLFIIISNPKKDFFKHPFLILFISFYLLHVLGLLTSDNWNTGGFELEKKLSLLLFPIFLGFPKINDAWVDRILLSFIITCSIATLYCFFTATIKYFLFNSSPYFLIGQFCGPIDIHRVYFSMFLLFSICILIYLLTKKPALILSLLYIAFILIFSFGIFLMAARMAIVVFIILSTTGFLYTFFAKKNKYASVSILLVLVTSLVFTFSNTNLRIKFSQMYTDLGKGNSKRNTTSANIRIIKWQCALEVLKENLIFGLGTGDVGDELYKKYVEKNFRLGIKERFNAHNQYLETGIGLGIPGLLLWLACLIWPFILSIQRKKYLYTAFIFIFASCCLTESMLCAQKGVVFYAFFNSLFAFHFLGGQPEKEGAIVR